MPPGGLVARVGAQHAAQLLHELPAVEPLDVGAGHAGARAGGVAQRLRLLHDPEMARGEGGDLRQMRDAEDLAAGDSARSRSPTARAVAPPTPASTSSNTTVGEPSTDGGDAHQREHHARQLTAGGDLAQRTRAAPRDSGRSGTRRSRHPPGRNGPAAPLRRSASPRSPPRTSPRPSPAPPAPRTPPSRARGRPCHAPARRRARQLVERGTWRSSSPSSRAVVSPAFASRSRSARQRSACSSTASIVPPCLRFSRASCSRRSSTTARRAGSASTEAR